MQGALSAETRSATFKVGRASRWGFALPCEQQQDVPRHFRPHLQSCPAESSAAVGGSIEETEAANPSDRQPTTVPIKVASATRVASRRVQAWKSAVFKRSMFLEAIDRAGASNIVEARDRRCQGGTAKPLAGGYSFRFRGFSGIKNRGSRDRKSQRIENP